jgi:HD-GYP domain-containing protein (c-di-GMP phosphodiesterase class II)
MLGDQNILIVTKAIVTFMAQIAKYHDSYGNGHSSNMAVIAVELAEVSGYPKKNLELLRCAAELHDIGKIAVPGNILNKVGELTAEDFEIIQQHSKIGYELIRPLELGFLIECAILQHHESYDGSGYPSGLRGENICIEARIIRITDAFDAMTNPRSYRQVLAVEEAVREMEKDARLFDPILLEIFLRRVIKT